MFSAAVIDTLSVKDQQELHALLTYKLRKARPDLTANEHAFWDAINDALGRAVKERLPLSMFLDGKAGGTGYGRTKYAEKLAEVEHVLESAIPALSRLPLKRSVMLIMIKCLVKYLTAIDIPATPKTLLNNTGLLVHAIDQVFPGYIAARLLHRVAVLGQRTTSPH